MVKGGGRDGGLVGRAAVRSVLDLELVRLGCFEPCLSRDGHVLVQRIFNFKSLFFPFSLWLVLKTVNIFWAYNTIARAGSRSNDVPGMVL